MKALRTQILDSLGARFRRELGVGKTGRPLRELRVGPWYPDSMPAPSLTLSDAGKRRADEFDGEDGGTLVSSILSAGVVLDLPANWAREGEADAWARVVEDIESLSVAWAGSAAARGMGVTAVRIQGDEPVKAILENGESRQLWTMDIEIEFAAMIAAQ